MTLFNNPHQDETQQPQQTVQMERPRYEHFLTPNFVMPKVENFKQIGTFERLMRKIDTEFSLEISQSKFDLTSAGKFHQLQ